MTVLWNLTRPNRLRHPHLPHRPMVPMGRMRPRACFQLDGACLKLQILWAKGSDEEDRPHRHRTLRDSLPLSQHLQSDRE